MFKSIPLSITDQQSHQLISSSSSYSQNRCAELTEELANQKAEFAHQLQSLRAELESEGGALRGRLEEMERERGGETC